MLKEEIRRSLAGILQKMFERTTKCIRVTNLECSNIWLVLSLA